MRYCLQVRSRRLAIDNLMQLSCLLARAAVLIALALVGCAKTKSPIPPGWSIAGKPLVSTQNTILPAGATLDLPERFLLQAMTDCVVHLTRNAAGETLLHLLAGTAMVQQYDAQPGLTLLANGNTIRAKTARLLLHNQMGSTRILLVDGGAAISHNKQRWELSAKTDNLFEMKGGTQIVKKLPTREIERLFPGIAGRRLMLAGR